RPVLGVCCRARGTMLGEQQLEASIASSWRISRCTCSLGWPVDPVISGSVISTSLGVINCSLFAVLLFVVRSAIEDLHSGTSDHNGHSQLALEYSDTIDRWHRKFRDKSILCPPARSSPRWTRSSQCARYEVFACALKPSPPQFKLICVLQL